ncbi:calmodulin calcium-dependent NAD kinase-like [Phragmites australis]|uniref:calmodulin calcium-dependent NAD kinase-like n=1 Tax=Phragmites australis TaxID=29695 RepID=UPI002D7918E3|nr:calmodulin calcium-dependent NAD kinase-like [Phragmites australis]
MPKVGFARVLLLHVAALATAGAVTAAAALARRRRLRGSKRKAPAMAEMPRLQVAESGRVEQLEKFSHYVARQLGFQDIDECPQLCKLANNYLKNTNNCIDDIYGFFENVEDAESLYVKFVEELEKCILGYFAFHWDHATYFISQALTVDSGTKKKLRNMVLEATRKQRFERVTRDLKVTRVFSTLVEEMKAIGIATASNGEEAEAQCTDVMAPMAHSDRSPVLLLMGGGMGAGKSTVLKELKKEPFWSKAEANAVVVEADAFKETDVIYRAISSMGHHNDMLQTAELVHQSSTDAASSLLVTALNEGRDVILDGTLSWEPFVEQTIAMARAVHRQRYRMGVGYKVADDGTISENYWEPVQDPEGAPNGTSPTRKPYRIEVVGVVCDAYLAVARGIRRAIITRRAVRVRSQLQSHKRFAGAFQKYSQLVDGARLYTTNSLGSAKLIAWKDGINSSLLVEPREFDCVEKVSNLNVDATSVHDLYPDGTTTCGSRSIWDDMIASPSRATIQLELQEAIRSMELASAEPATPAL